MDERNGLGSYAAKEWLHAVTAAQNQQWRSQSGLVEIHGKDIQGPPPLA